jgi:hypothetical protein
MSGWVRYGFAVPSSPNIHPSRHRRAGEGVQAGRASARSYEQYEYYRYGVSYGELNRTSYTVDIQVVLCTCQ